MWVNCLTVRGVSLTNYFCSDLNVRDLFNFQQREGKAEDISEISDLKCGFGRDREKSLKCGNRVPYRGENAVRPTPKPFQCSRFIADRPHFKSLHNREAEELGT